MAAAFQLPVTAAQVGTYFVGRYYHVLQHQPEFVHQFYSDASTALRIDGNARDTATTMLHIHALVMSLNYSAIEIKTTHSLESWKSGVLVMVSGTVHVNDYNRRRKFMQTFFLAPQEKGYFILNDIFHFVEEEQLVQHPVAYLAPGNLDPNLSASTAILGQASNYVHDGGFQSREYVDGGFQQSREYVDGGFQQSREYVDGGFQQSREYVDGGFQSREYIDGGFQSREYVDGGFQSREYVVPEIEENGLPDEYGFSEERLQNVHETDKVLEDNFAGQSNGSLHSGVKPLQDHLSVPVDEAVGGGAQKLTYASILAKGQAAQASVEKAASSLSEWQNMSDSSVHHSSGPSSNVVERHVVEPVEEAAEDEVEVKSVYVKNVPTTMAASEIEVEFKKFGRLRPDGVAIRTRKDIDICYAFVEFEDISGVQNAIQASVVEIDGHRLYIEGRRPNRGILIRGRGRGRGRVGYYPMDGGSRGGGGGRFSGRFFGRGNNNNSQDQVRNNGFYRQASRQDY